MKCSLTKNYFNYFSNVIILKHYSIPQYYSNDKKSQKKGNVSMDVCNKLLMDIEKLVRL